MCLYILTYHRTAENRESVFLNGAQDVFQGKGTEKKPKVLASGTYIDIHHFVHTPGTVTISILVFLFSNH